MGNVRRLFMLGKISWGHFYECFIFSLMVLLAFAFLLSCCTNTVCSASSTGMEK